MRLPSKVTIGGIPLTDYPVKYSALSGKPSIAASTTGDETWIVNSTAVSKLRGLTIKTNYGTDNGSTGSGSISISGGNGLSLESRFGNIRVSDASTGYKWTSLSNYPKKWSQISSKPRATDLFGYVFEKATTSSDPDEYWPAVAVKDSYGSYSSVYKFNGYEWVMGTVSEFISFNDTDPH